MFEELKLTEDLTIYKSEIKNINNTILVEDLEFSCELSKTIYGGYDKSPGVQNKNLVTSKNITILKSTINDKIVSFFNLTDDYICFYDNWCFIADNNNTISQYHNHTEYGNDTFIKELPQWTIVYYVQMPDNLKDDEGVLYFKTKTGREISILPKENELLLFNTDILHRPQIFKNSTKKRVVYASNITILDRNKIYNKKTKTLL